MDLDAFVERAAIMEYCGGLSRFLAETEAARAQGFRRWEVLNAISERDSAYGRNIGQANDRNAADNLPEMLGGANEKNRSVPGGDVHRGGRSVAVLALRVQGDQESG